MILQTPYGPIKYIIFGSGYPVLWIHGVVGGYDQGEFMSKTLIGENFQVISVSRYGYPGTDIQKDSSPSAQADQYSFLLEKLNIDKVILIGSSAGTSSSLQFALKYPDKCKSLILWSPAVPPYKIPPKSAQIIMRRFFSSDFLWRVMIKYFPALLKTLMGIPKDIQKRLRPEENTWVKRVMYNFLPVSKRVDEIMNDILITNPDLNKNYPYENIKVPVLIIHAVDDPMPPYNTSKKIAKTIPGAEFYTVEDGGHLLLGHLDKVREKIVKFIISQIQDSNFGVQKSTTE